MVKVCVVTEDDDILDRFKDMFAISASFFPMESTKDVSEAGVIVRIHRVNHDSPTKPFLNVKTALNKNPPEIYTVSKKDKGSVLYGHGHHTTFGEMDIIVYDTDELFANGPLVIKRALEKRGSNKFTSLSSIPADWIDVLVRKEENQEEISELSLIGGNPVYLFRLFPKGEWKRAGSHSYLNGEMKLCMYQEGTPRPGNGDFAGNRCHLVVFNTHSESEPLPSKHGNPVSQVVMSRTIIYDPLHVEDTSTLPFILPSRYLPIPNDIKDLEAWDKRAEQIELSLTEPEHSDSSHFHESHTLLGDWELTPMIQNSIYALSGARYMKRWENDMVSAQDKLKELSLTDEDEKQPKEEYKAVCRKPDGSLCEFRFSKDCCRLTGFEISLSLCYGHQKDNKTSDEYHKTRDQTRKYRDKKNVIFRSDNDIRKAAIYETMIKKFKELEGGDSEDVVDPNDKFNWVISGSNSDFQDDMLKNYNYKNSIVIHLYNTQIFDYGTFQEIMDQQENLSRGFMGIYVIIIPNSWTVIITEINDSETTKDIKNLLSVRNIYTYECDLLDEDENELDFNLTDDTDKLPDSPKSELAPPSKKSVYSEEEMMELEVQKEKEVFKICSIISEDLMVATENTEEK